MVCLVGAWMVPCWQEPLRGAFRRTPLSVLTTRPPIFSGPEKTKGRKFHGQEIFTGRKFSRGRKKTTRALKRLQFGYIYRILALMDHGQTNNPLMESARKERTLNREQSRSLVPDSAAAESLSGPDTLPLPLKERLVGRRGVSLVRQQKVDTSVSQPSPGQADHPLANVQMVPLLDKSVDTVPKQERTSSKRSIIAKAFEQARMTLEELLPWRIIVAWRITRWHGQLRDILQPSTPLQEILQGVLDGMIQDPWTHPASTQGLQGGIPGNQQVGKAIRYLTEGPPPGFGLLPPDAPENDPYLDPYEDRNLLHFIGVVEQASIALRIRDGSSADQELGTLGMRGLLDPDMIREAWPSPGQIMAWESLLIEQVLELRLHYSPSRIRRELLEKFALSPAEIQGLLDMAKVQAMQDTDLSKEEARALMVLRLEQYASRAREDCNLREELAALKQLSIIQGLSDRQDGDEDGDFIKIIEMASNKRKQVTSGQTKALPKSGN